MKKHRMGIISVLVSLLFLAIPHLFGAEQKVMVAIFEENIDRFSSDSFLKGMIVEHFSDRGIPVLELYEIPLKSIRMERVYFLDKNGQKVFQMAELSAGLSAGGMKINTEYQENIIPIIKYEDIIWDLNYEKAIEQARTAHASLLIAGKIETQEIFVQSSMAVSGMKSVSARISIRLIEMSTKNILMSYADTLTMMGASAETAGLDAIRDLGNRAIERLKAKIEKSS